MAELLNKCRFIDLKTSLQHRFSNITAKQLEASIRSEKRSLNRSSVIARLEKALIHKRRIEKSGDAPDEIVRWERVLMLIRKLSKCHMSIKSISELIDMSERSAYRYLQMLERLGLAIEKDFEYRYFIAADICQFCGKELRHA